MDQGTKFTLTGLQVDVTPGDVEAAAKVGVNPVAYAIHAWQPDSQPSADAQQIDLTVDGRAYFYAPDGALQEAIEAFERGEAFAPGTYHATHVEIDPRDQGDEPW